MKPRPFRFGVLCEQMDTQRSWMTKARQIEDAGYATWLCCKKKADLLK